MVCRGSICTFAGELPNAPRVGTGEVESPGAAVAGELESVGAAVLDEARIGCEGVLFGDLLIWMGGASSSRSSRLYIALLDGVLELVLVGDWL